MTTHRRNEHLTSTYGGTKKRDKRESKAPKESIEYFDREARLQESQLPCPPSVDSATTTKPALARKLQLNTDTTVS